MVFLQSSLGAFVLASQCIGGVQGLRRGQKAEEAVPALTAEELHSLDWVRTEDRPLCEFLMAQCKVNTTACNMACTTTLPAKMQGHVEGSIAGFDLHDWEMNASEYPSLGDFISAGEFVWGIIKDGAPVSSISNKHVSVLEKDSAWYDYAGWIHRRSIQHRVLETTNAFGSVVSSVDMTMDFNFGGNFRGRGRYVKNCWASPSVYVGWSNSVDGKATRLDPSNRGTRANPCAEANIIFSFTYGSYLFSGSSDWKFTYRCDGYWSMSPL